MEPENLDDLPFDLPSYEQDKPRAQPEQTDVDEPVKAPVAVPGHAAPDEAPQPSRQPVSIESEPIPQEDEEVEGPWETPLDLLKKVEAYNEEGNYKSYDCSCSRFLNTVLHSEVFGNLVKGVELSIYPDCAGVAPAREDEGCLQALRSKLSERQKFGLDALGVLLNILAEVLIFLIFQFLNFMAFILSGPSGWMAAMIQLFLTILLFAIPIILLLTYPLYTIGALIAIFIVGYIISYLNQKRVQAMVRRILENPKSAYAIKKIFNLMDLVPCYWRRGDIFHDIVQIIRVDTRRRLHSRSLILLVQDNPVSTMGGCMAMGVQLLLSVYFGRLFNAQHRIYVLCMDKGKNEADAAAEELSGIFGVPVTRGGFRLNSLRLT